MRTSTLDILELERRLRRAGIVPVVRVAEPETARSLVDRLLAAGLDVIELTITIAGWQEVASTIRAEHPEVCVGVGTVSTAELARQAIDTGAHFCVSPRLVPGARAELEGAGVPFLEGGLTPTEVLDAASRGIAKLFPAHVGGVRYLTSLLAVEPQARIMPTGGIPLGEVGAWLRAGAVAVGVGSDLTAPGDVAGRVREALEE
ncbi:MAG: aldolase [Candidatus Nephthysia bennettiae]|uniref:Bifunctional 4-hydroxy-2-oxoglutarate aldolase/2-dehydro-3-deoxy-phosphogluconate aldolase n=1 Tax=Candidatus Nephthysia bennettiae TaxID=3127016 RepID=A0A934N731_9BACT|nr:bifunctional 4-hydroxy-2-oxoglutarate aldolase/2-dehydro-3-deoxy-phosphogluconate aldolase [Candidatus Dormibacteraeota bacterium]MBJ7614481.1 bifunctional 4-hydroxy-2-oxoglutarate aldolase/2-dehydro-3-deoxy-phosphogluconate aldolase [Candidatus Dormibacteraeota bacterium]PZR86125.1 MAG: aldolase [Candidatus Dormibacteraeota bacterium]